MSNEAHYWTLLPDGRVECELCPRHCKLADGARGACFVRQAEGGRMVLTTYGRSSGFCVDPIEKKPLNHFLPGTPILSFGTAGCNLQCRFCQNWSLSRSHEMDILGAKASPERIAEAAEALGCRSVAFTYNDPVIFMEYAVDIARACHERDIRTVAVTAGYVEPEPRALFFQHMDAANIDLKAFSDRFYTELCGGHLQPVLDSIEYAVKETNCWVELTTLLIPGENDDPQELQKLVDWVVEHLGVDVPLHFSAFFPAWKLQDHPCTPLSTLRLARQLALDAGVRYVYTGNVRDRKGHSTWCHHCGALLIGREGYELGEWGLDEKGQCRRCGTVCAGVFEPVAGHWGGRCQPVRI